MRTPDWMKTSLTPGWLRDSRRRMIVGFSLISKWEKSLGYRQLGQRQRRQELEWPLRAAKRFGVGSLRSDTVSRKPLSDERLRISPITDSRLRMKKMPWCIRSLWLPLTARGSLTIPRLGWTRHRTLFQRGIHCLIDPDSGAWQTHACRLRDHRLQRSQLR